MTESSITELEERLTEAQAQLEALQAAAADAEARAATTGEELTAAREAREAAEAQLDEVRSRLRDAAVRYREARLSAAPEIPQELVPERESIEEIDRDLEAAQAVVSRLKERMEEESRGARVPAGSPPRRQPDLSSLPASEKIRLGLQDLERRG
jgi:chromosome segregation ATPase